jgi:succinate dehydrogenase / fumarate reductase cytochrome b subunit
MLVSILHRGTGIALSVAGLFLLTWWLIALAGGPSAYGTFSGFIGWKLLGIPVILLGLVGLTWSFFQHTLSGVRHLIMDIGAGFELGTNKRMAYATIIGSFLLTAAFWAALLLGKAA